MRAKELSTCFRGLLQQLQVLYGGTLDTLFSEFVLSFVQSLPTSIDAKLSEHLLKRCCWRKQLRKALLLHSCYKVWVIVMCKCDAIDLHA